MSNCETQAGNGTLRTVFPSGKQPLADPVTCSCVKYSLEPADPDAAESTRELLRILYDMSKSKAVMFGQQNADIMRISFAIRISLQNMPAQSLTAAVRIFL